MVWFILMSMTTWWQTSARLSSLLPRLWLSQSYTHDREHQSYTKIIDFIHLESSNRGTISSSFGDWTRSWCLSTLCDKRGFGRQDVFAEVWMTNWMCSAHRSTHVQGERWVFWDVHTSHCDVMRCLPLESSEIMAWRRCHTFLSRGRMRYHYSPLR